MGDGRQKTEAHTHAHTHSFMINNSSDYFQLYHINAVITSNFEFSTMANNYISIHLLRVSNFHNNDSSENFYDFSNIDIERKCDKENFLLNLIFR